MTLPTEFISLFWKVRDEQKSFSSQFTDRMEVTFWEYSVPDT